MYNYFVQVPPATPLHLWPHVRGGVVSTAFDHFFPTSREVLYMVVTVLMIKLGNIVQLNH